MIAMALFRLAQREQRRPPERLLTGVERTLVVSEPSVVLPPGVVSLAQWRAIRQMESWRPTEWWK